MNEIASIVVTTTWQAVGVRPGWRPASAARPPGLRLIPLETIDRSAYFRRCDQVVPPSRRMSTIVRLSALLRIHSSSGARGGAAEPADALDRGGRGLDAGQSGHFCAIPSCAGRITSQRG